MHYYSWKAFTHSTHQLWQKMEITRKIIQNVKLITSNMKFFLQMHPHMRDATHICHYVYSITFSNVFLSQITFPHKTIVSPQQAGRRTSDKDMAFLLFLALIYLPSFLFHGSFQSIFCVLTFWIPNFIFRPKTMISLIHVLFFFHP